MVRAMNLRRLRHFDTLYRLASYARAADELGLTQSALTRSIQKLEEELGATLFDRTTHYVRPTSDADRLIRSARDVIAASANLEQEARGLGQPTGGTVAVGSGPYPLQPLLKLVDEHDLRAPGERADVEPPATAFATELGFYPEMTEEKCDRVLAGHCGLGVPVAGLVEDY